MEKNHACHLGPRTLKSCPPNAVRPPTPPPPPPSPAQIPALAAPALPWQVVAKVGCFLGSGSYGTCYLAELGSKAKAVLKFANTNGPMAAQGQHIIRAEAMAAAALQHPNLVKVLGLMQLGDQIDSVWAFAMGLPFFEQLPKLNKYGRVCLVLQLLSVLGFCTKRRRSLWDCHHRDLYVEIHEGGAHLTIIDAFMAPDEVAGSSGTFGAGRVVVEFPLKHWERVSKNHLIHAGCVSVLCPAARIKRLH